MRKDKHLMYRKIAIKALILASLILNPLLVIYSFISLNIIYFLGVTISYFTGYLTQTKALECISQKELENKLSYWSYLKNEFLLEKSFYKWLFNNKTLTETLSDLENKAE